MKIKQIIESMGGTTAGAIASVASPLGATQKRSRPEKAPKVAKAKKYANVISEGKMKDLAYDLEHLDAGNFKKKYGQPKEYFTKKLGNPPVVEAELQEDDLILVPGQIRKKDKSFTPHDKDRRDHEVEMARKELYAAAQDAMRIFKLIKDRSENEGLMGWQQSYITLASDYLNSVADSLAHVPGTNEMTGGVLAGGMSNFEEGRYYDPMGDERREQQAMDDERRDFKRREMEYELRGEEEAIRRANEGPWYIRIDGKIVKDKNKEPYFFSSFQAAQKAVRTMRDKAWNQGKEFSYSRTPTDAEKKLDEKKDACYTKVKSRYKVWPSAYASGALSKCRKVGASNWGNKSKK